MRALGLLAITLLLPGAHAAEILALDVNHDRGTYTVSFDVLIDGRPERVRALLTDYDHLDRLSETVTESRVLAVRGAVTRLKLSMRGCVLFLCKNTTRVQDAEAGPGDEITTRIVPAPSDFREGAERWRIRASARRTRVTYEASFVPDFFVPPLIGPLLIESAIRRELRTAAERLESLAR